MTVNEFIAAYSSDPSSVNLDVSPQEIAARADAQVSAAMNSLDWSALDSFKFSDKLPPMSLDAARALSNSGTSSGAGYNPNPFGGGSFTFEQMVVMQNGTATYSQMMNPGTRLINDTPGFGYALAGMAGMMIAPYAAPLIGPAVAGMMAGIETAITSAGIATYGTLTTAGMLGSRYANQISSGLMQMQGNAQAFIDTVGRNNLIWSGAIGGVAQGGAYLSSDDPNKNILSFINKTSIGVLNSVATASVGVLKDVSFTARSLFLGVYNMGGNYIDLPPIFANSCD